MVVTAVAIVALKDLFAAVMLSGIYGLLSASFFVLMDAVDVAFTEAAVGAGIAPLLMFAALALSGRFEKSKARLPLLSAIPCLLIGGLLIWAAFDLPAFADGRAPAHLHVAPRYIVDSVEEIGIPNMVTSVLASYRAFDTFGEVVVIFTAGMGVAALLLADIKRPQGEGNFPLRHHLVLRVVGKIFIPPIMIFALYVQFHGEYGPGGGFQAGVIFAAALILFAMLFGLNSARAIVSLAALRLLAAVGVLLFGAVGVLNVLAGKNFLDYSSLATNSITGQHIGILLVELGVGITVTAVMLLIYFAFADREQWRVHAGGEG